MYELTIITHFGAAHQLRNFGGKCEALHGHNWKIEVSVKGGQLDQTGLLMDFALIKKAAGDIIDRLDHKFLNELDFFSETNPSSENIAFYIYKSLEKELNNDHIMVSRVTAWESDSSCASYTES
ncbi:MAG: 6-carboxytetrahydropterin synthase QueD [Deltaproteobacteria bacterium]|nr:6-carboxytetrahydropterin synthase QueD [Deltaproteobacteria bacterium]